MDQTEYDDLTDNERHLIRTILNMLEKSHLIKNQDEEFNEKFQILLGSYNAGNNSEILKSQLKQYIIHAMKLNLIPRNVGHQMLLELSL
jgi:protein involved in ribonucleotide reduction